MDPQKNKKQNKVLPIPDHGPILTHILQSTDRGHKTTQKIVENHMQATGMTNKLLENEVEATMRVAQELRTLADKLDPQEIGDGKMFMIKGVRGETGPAPTDEELLKLIKPLIPKVEDGKDGKNGHTPTNKELIALIKPFIPEVEDGHTPTKKELLALIRPLIDEIKIPVPKDGVDGKPGAPGRDAKVDIAAILKSIKSKLSIDDMKGFDRLQDFIAQRISSKTYSLSELDDVDLSQATTNSKGKYIIPAPGGSGSGLTKETPSGLVNDSNVTFTVTHQPFFINVNGAIYNVGDGAYTSYVAGTITLAYPVGTGGFIKSYY